MHHDPGCSKLCTRCQIANLGGTLYPDGYRDPEWDGSEAQFRDIVLPARLTAIAAEVNRRFADVLPEGARFKWVSGEDEAP
jgi:hypothetical protein